MRPVKIYKGIKPPTGKYGVVWMRGKNLDIPYIWTSNGWQLLFKGDMELKELELKVSNLTVLVNKNTDDIANNKTDINGNKEDILNLDSKIVDTVNELIIIQLIASEATTEEVVELFDEDEADTASVMSLFNK